MKTTVEISDLLLQRARRLAAREGTTLRALIEEALRAVIQSRGSSRRGFVLRNASFKGDGLAHGVRLENWSEVRSRIYDDRGGS